MPFDRERIRMSFETALYFLPTGERDELKKIVDDLEKLREEEAGNRELAQFINSDPRRKFIAQKGAKITLKIYLAGRG